MKERKLPQQVVSTIADISNANYELRMQEERRENLTCQTASLIRRSRDIALSHGALEKKCIIHLPVSNRCESYVEDMSYAITPDVRGKVEVKDIWIRLRENSKEKIKFQGKNGFIIEFREDSTDTQRKYTPLYTLSNFEIAKNWKGEEVSEGEMVEIGKLLDFIDQSLQEDGKKKLTSEEIGGLLDKGKSYVEEFRNSIKFDRVDKLDERHM